MEISAQLEEGFKAILNNLSQDNIDQLFKKADAGEISAQKLVANMYFHGTQRIKQDSVEAEKWLLKAHHNGDTNASTALVALAKQSGDNDKIIRYASYALERGYPQYELHIATAYANQKQYKKAVEHFEHTIATLDHIPQHKDCRNQALINYATLLKDGKGTEKDRKRSLAIFERLVRENNASGLFSLACEYLFDDGVVTRDVSKAKKLLLKAISLQEPIHSPSEHYMWSASHTALGFILERGLDGTKPNAKKAAFYYQKDASDVGKMQHARLIATNKCEGDKDKAKELIKSYATNKKFAAYLHGTLELMEGRSETGVAFLEYFNKTVTPSWPLVQLQLAIAYTYGFGVGKDDKKAQTFLNSILNGSNTRFRSFSLVRGYMRVYGLGVKQDINLGLKLIEESEAKMDDVMFATEELFPAITQLRNERSLQLLEKESLKTPRDNKQGKIGSPQQKKGSSSNTTHKKSDTTQKLSNPFTFSAKEWNSFFKTADESYIREINPTERTIIIADPNRDEELIVYANKEHDRHLMQITPLHLHKRIAQRQDSRITQSEKVAYDHSFAQMLDYVIQYVGDVVPFTKNGTTVQDQLMASVNRHNLKTGETQLCTAEYTFCQSGDDVCVYHRLLRPEQANS